VRVVSLLVEGVGMRATARLTRLHTNTVAAILAVAGSKCAFFLDRRVRNNTFPFVQVDELFCFCRLQRKKQPQ
jgi:hypothetical protein